MGLEGNESQLVYREFCQQVVHGDISHDSDLLNPLPDLLAQIEGIHCLNNGSQGQAVEPIFILVVVQGSRQARDHVGTEHGLLV